MSVDFLDAAFSDAELEQEMAESLFDRDDEDLDGERIALIVELAHRRVMAGKGGASAG
jgi:hypothetical protein